MAIGESGNIDWPEHRLYHSRLVHWPHCCCRCPSSSINLTVHPFLTHDQGPMILELSRFSSILPWHRVFWEDWEYRCNPPIVGTHSPVLFLIMGTTTPISLYYPCPPPPLVCHQRQAHNIQRLEVLVDFIHPLPCHCRACRRPLWLQSRWWPNQPLHLPFLIPKWKAYQWHWWDPSEMRSIFSTDQKHLQSRSAPHFHF